MFKVLLKFAFVLVCFIVFTVGGVLIYITFAPQIGQSPAGDHLERISQSPNYGEAGFINNIPTAMADPLKIMWEVGDEFFFNAEIREPKEAIKTIPFDKAKITSIGADKAAISWFGHSTTVIRIEGKTILTDPVFGQRASMFGFAGPERFNYDPRPMIEQLPEIDAVIISHDHYDHLDYYGITHLIDRVKHFYTPLGVGSHLRRWGVPEEKITELDWWEETVFENNITLIATPSRHFSGRGLNDGNKTQWASWTIIGQQYRVYFSGDTGYFPGFKEIGDKYGPFDFVMMECGAYNKLWPNIHLMPEESAQACLDLRGRVLMPIHWGKFNLALHPWKEPVERLHAALQGEQVIIAQPEVGQVFYIDLDIPTAKWWERYE